MKYFKLLILFILSPILIIANGSAVIPSYQDDYSCGIFPSVLASYQSITAVQNDIYNTCVISVKDYNLVEDTSHNITCYTGLDDSTPKCECTADECSMNSTCEVIPEPTNRYSHDFIDTNVSGVIYHSGNIEFTELYYPSYVISKSGNSGEVKFNPSNTYSDSTKKVMIFGDINLTSSGQEMIFEEGDYYFNSLNLDNTPDITVNGTVRFFVKNDFVYSGNSMDSFNNGSLFIYIGGDLKFTSSGGGHGFLDMFFYLLGDAYIEANAKASALFGGISAEGNIVITGNNMNFIYNEEGAEAMGYGECKLCYALSDEASNLISFENLATFSFNSIRDTAIVNQSGITLSNTSVDQIEGTGKFNIGTSNYSVVDENGDLQSNSINSTCSKNGMVSCSEYTTMADLQNYEAGGLDDYKAIRTQRTGFSFLTDDTFIINAIYYDNDKKYEIELDYCDISGSGVADPILGSFDAWDNSSTDRNITTKIVNQDFELRMISFNDLGEIRTKPGVDVRYQLYDYDTSQAVTTWFTFDVNSNSTSPKVFNIKNAYRDVRVLFKFCQSDSNGSLTSYATCDGAGTPGYDFNTSIASNDNFAIRPDKFVLGTPTGEDINLLTAGVNYNFSLTALEFGNTTPANNYDINDAQTILQVSQVQYKPDGSEATASLNGLLSLTQTSTYNILNGSATNGIGLSFTDIGKVNVKLQDITWASVDIGNDTTPVDCSANGAYICGDIDTTFIPDHFMLSGATLINDNNRPFTYISNDLNMSARVGVTITALNSLNNITQNFDSTSWENPVSVTIDVNTAGAPASIKNNIISKNVGFTNGVAVLNTTALDTSRNLFFNYTRDASVALNPFIVNSTDVDINASSTYGTISVSVPGAVVNPLNTATMVYGRTNSPLSRFAENSNQKAFIYYEIYCNTTTGCDKTLLPNANPTYTDDPRWFINTAHTLVSGTAGNVNQKGFGVGAGVVTQDTVADGSATNFVVLDYDGTRGKPYRTTMENLASSWLIYNRYNAGDTNNEFNVAFEGGDTSWAGKNTSKIKVDRDASKTSRRRSMW